MSVRSVIRAYKLLQLIAESPAPLGVNEISRQAALHKSTVSRLLLTMEDLGMVDRQPDGRLLVGRGLRRLVEQDGQAPTLRQMARPFMLELQAIMGEDVGLAVPDGDHVRFVDQILSMQQAVRVRDWTGTRFPLHSSASGKLILAHRSDSVLESYLTRPFEQHTGQTMTDPERLREACYAARKNGYDWSVDEFADGHSGVAAPIYDRDLKLIAVLNVFAPSFRFPPAGQKERVTALVVDAANRFSELIQRLPVGPHID